MRSRILPILALLSGGCGCRSVESADDVRTWANAGSAVAVYTYGHGPISLADGQSEFADPACPVTDDDGTTVTIEGGCTDSAGVEWTGTATVTRTADGDRLLMLEAYAAIHDPDLRATVTGSFDLLQVEPTFHEFEVDLVQEGGLTTTVEYSGSVEGDYDTATVFNGSGSVERDGMVSPTGTVRVSTADEVLDDAVCAGQAVSGRTSIKDGDHTAVVEYDGATDCDEDQAARWHLDGEDQGRITGIVCSAAVPGAAPTLPWGLGGMIAAALLARRRTRGTLSPRCGIRLPSRSASA